MEQVEMSSRTQAGKSGEEGFPSRAASGRREHRSRRGAENFGRYLEEPGLIVAP